MKYSNIVSDRDVNEWIYGCPIRIRNVKITKSDDEAFPALSVTSDVCIDLAPLSYTARVEIQNRRRERIGEVCEIRLHSGVSELVPLDVADAAYASVTVQSVFSSEKLIWSNDNGISPSPLPEQGILWQIDPHYEQIKIECEGVTPVKYIPDTIDSAWRCTCGHVNLEGSAKCGGCGVAREWLNVAFDRDYLEAKKNARIAVEIKNKKREKKHNRVKMPSWLPAICVLLVIALCVTLAVLTFTKFIPQAKYNKAVSLAENGEYDEAILLFRELGDFSDSARMEENTVYKKAQMMTGLDEVLVVDSARYPCFSITDDGVPSFHKDYYVGEWDVFVLPDVVDGVIVRELSRNFLMNCNKVVSVIISDCTEIIGEQAFYNCTALENVYFGKSVSTINQRAFINCTSIKEIEIPDSVTWISPRAFNNCTSLRKVIIGAGVSDISSYTFSNCTSLERVTLTTPVTAVRDNAFFACDKLAKIYCKFSEGEYSPEISDGNEAFVNAKKYFDQ